MEQLLAKLDEQRSAAVKALEDFASPLLGENRSLTEAEEAKYNELRKDVKRIDKRRAEISEQIEAERAQAEARAAVASAAVVKSEARTYGEGSPNSYIADLARASSTAWKGHGDAVQRLQRHSHEMAVDAASDTKVRSRVASQLREVNRTENGIESRRSLTDMLETRAGMDTTGSSGGSFVTPVYDVADYAPYNQFGRVFIDQANKQDLPEYGMTVYIPHVTGPAGVAAQSSQGNGVQETDPTAGYLSANLTTNAGQVTISQQLLDRAGPNFKFDKLVFDQLQRDYAFVVNQFVLTAALAAAGSISEGTQVTPTLFYGNVAAAKAATVNAAGTVLPATHLFATPTQWEWLASRMDGSGRPVFVPSANGPFNAFGSGPGDSVAQGDTGYKVLGLRVFEDGGIPLTNAGADQQVIVAHMPEVWVFEGDLVPRVIPQTFAQNLQILMQIYAYIAVIPRYPLAVQSITGAGYPAAPTF